MDDILDGVDDGCAEGPGGVQISDVDVAIDAVLARRGATWQRGVRLDLASRSWVPSAVDIARRQILYVCLTSEIPNYITIRLAEASAEGWQITVALNVVTLYSPATLRILAICDADAIVLDGLGRKAVARAHFLSSLARNQVAVSVQERTVICRETYRRLSEGNSYIRGRRFEALLAFLLGQVQDFRVVGQNVRTATQELDIVLQVDRHSDRPWNLGVPYILVEAKNWTVPADQQVVAAFMAKIQSKGPSCKIGFLICTSGITEDGMNHELRYSMSPNRIVMMGADELDTLVNSEQLDQDLDDIVRNGLLR